MSQKLRGFVGQAMGGKKSQRDARIVFAGAPIAATSGSGSFTASRTCWALIAAWGGAGSGGRDDNSPGNGSSGGGGGGAVYKKWRLLKGQTISWTVGAGGVAAAAQGPGNAGVATTVTLPDGSVMTAGGGGPGLQGVAPLAGGAGGTATGGDLNRPGGAGGATTGVSTANAGETPNLGASGGQPRNANPACGGGGGSGGFADIDETLRGGAGSDGNNGPAAGAAPGGGSGGAADTASSAGGAGRVYIASVRAL